MEIIKELLYIFITAAVPILTTYLGKFLYAKWEESKARINNEQTVLILDQVLEVVNNAVQTTNQVMVDELKKKGEFTKEAAVEAFEKTKTTVLAMLSEEAKEVVTIVYGDVNTYLDTLIEATVKNLK